VIALNGWRVAGLASLIVCGGAFAAAPSDEVGSVLVQTQVPQRGSMPDSVVGYGRATPAINGGLTLSRQAEGRVMRIEVSAGEAVHAGQPLLEFQLSAAANSSYQQAVSALQLAQEQRSRTARLLEQQLATRDQLAQAAKAVSDAQAVLTALELEHAGAAEQVISAPFDGVVSALPVAQGERVAAGAPLAILTRRGGLVITVGVEPSVRRAVRVGDAVDLTPLADGEPVLQGTVTRVDRVLNPKTRLIDVDVTPREQGATEPLEGAAFRAGIRTGELQGWLVPRDAVLADEQGDYLFQVVGGKAVRVAVKRLGGDEQRSVVDGALDPQYPIVTLGNYQLRDGAPVRLRDQPTDAHGT